MLEQREGTVADVAEGPGDSAADPARVIAWAPAIVYVYDPRTRESVYQNRPLGELLGYPPDDVLANGIGQWRHLMHPDDQERFPDHRARLADLAPGETALFTYRMRHADGSWHHIQSRDTRPPDAGEPVIVGTATDITEQRLAEAALAEREAHLADALQAKDEFLGLVSHELRTPMTIIMGMSRLLVRGDLDAEQLRDVAGDIAESADVLNDLLEGMLLLARLDRHEVAQLREPVLLHRVAADVVERWRERERRATFVLEVAERTAIVDVQRTWLERMIENLVSNAAKYGGRGATITVVVDRTPGMARLRVLDDGPGLGGADAGRLFEPFYRAPEAHERAPGIGLGLAIADRIVGLLGGRIWAADRPEGGAEFGFELPIAEDDEG
jgi:PAS domain S-box-containing protein